MNAKVLPEAKRNNHNKKKRPRRAKKGEFLPKKKRIETPLHYNVSILASFVELVEYCSRSSWLVINAANRPNRIYLIFPKILFDMFELVKPLIWGV